MFMRMSATLSSSYLKIKMNGVFMKSIMLTVFFAFLFNPLPAMAYIDPGSGSAIISAVIGFFVAIGLVVKTYWYKLKSLFSGKKSDSE